MRQHNKYLEKVYDEMDVYRQHLLTGTELTMTQEETFAKMDICRGWLQDGYSDTEVIRMLKKHPQAKIQERRAREILAMSYEVFAELRQLRNRDGIKYLYAEQFRDAARLALQAFTREISLPDSQDVDFTFGDKSPLTLNLATERDLKGAAMLLREYKNLLKEAAAIDGAYDNSIVPTDDMKKPTKVIIKRKTVIKNGATVEDNITEEAEYEEIE
ncbi:MAG: hypothetical protein LCH91_05495 [Bacteroidetes bacterium]|nr:hypothetical protein [Bacteroidota bacterium]